MTNFRSFYIAVGTAILIAFHPFPAFTQANWYCEKLQSKYNEKFEYWNGRIKILKSENEPHNEVFIKNIKRAFEYEVRILESEAKRYGCNIVFSTSLESIVEIN